MASKKELTWIDDRCYETDPCTHFCEYRADGYLHPCKFNGRELFIMLNNLPEDAPLRKEHWDHFQMYSPASVPCYPGMPVAVIRDGGTTEPWTLHFSQPETDPRFHREKLKEGEDSLETLKEEEGYLERFKTRLDGIELNQSHMETSKKERAKQAADEVWERIKQMALGVCQVCPICGGSSASWCRCAEKRFKDEYIKDNM